jgi:hypothetical protein
MAEPFMRTKHFKCPDCSTVGFMAQLQGEDGWRLSKGFQPSVRDGYLVVTCDCGARVLPQENSN